MDSEPCSSQDPTDTQPSNLQHLVAHDVFSFGVACELPDLNLPTKGDILRYYFFLAERAKAKSKMFSYKTFTPQVADRLFEIWSELDIELILKGSIIRKLNALIDAYRNVVKQRITLATSFREFVQSTNELFNIGKCQCNLKVNDCSCGSIPENLKDFMRDQYNERILTIPEHDSASQDTIPTTIPTIPMSNDPTYQPDDDAMEVDMGGSSQSVLTPQTYTPRYNTKNYAMMCDRFGVHDRMGSALATALMEDLGIKDAHDNLIIINKNKLRREREKWRQEALRRRYDGSNLISFSFDGRKNDALTLEKIDEKLHPRMVREPHLVVLREPHSQLIGYTKLENETAAHKVNKLIDFFQEKQLSLDSLIGICSDGEPANTGIQGGILRLFEKQLKRPLHWFVCLLHFNELPFRHLFDTLEKSTTTVPRSTTGKLSTQIADCEKFPVCNLYSLFFTIFHSIYQLLCFIFRW